ncbi:MULTISPECIES: hypothetical protein [Olivibacter]|uniref:Uncharacterized protein n=1 Tax=Olivibacter jilunii TaxID=985016 RepID=A0ABW6AZF9_9SPHI
MEIVRIKKQPSVEDLVLSIGVDDSKPFDLKTGASARVVISRLRKSKDYNHLRFETWTDTVGGEDVIMIHRLEDEKEEVTA